MDNADLSSKPTDLSASQAGDIPEALRDVSTLQPQPRLKKPQFLIWGLVGLAIALLLSFLLNVFIRPALNPAIPQSAVAFSSSMRFVRDAMVRAGMAAPDSPYAAETLLGHLPYEEAPAEMLRPVVADGSIRLRRAAAESFTSMVAAARAEGIILVPISGFRSLADQEYLFFQVKAQQGEKATERAEVSAPPGYSEHHTGYAVDIADGSQMETELETDFELTPGFQWLQRNSAYFNFELSFPKDNLQGVSYEPWHWRFVGDRDSLETFYKARNMG